jgi:hypothetical protein
VHASTGKKGRKPNTTDLNVEEWRIPVGRVETTRKGEGEEGRVADDDCDSHARKSERGEEGRERRDQGRHNTQKSGGEGAPIDIGTGGVRGSDERGDRRAEERQKKRGMGRTREWDGRGDGQVASETKETRGQKLFGGEGSERNPSSPLTTLHVQGGQLCVWRGQPHSPFKKKEEEEGI